MFAHGYRPAGAQHHKNTFAFMRQALDESYDQLVTYFDRMRNKRNQAIYDVAGLITATEAEYLLDKATEFVGMICRELRTEP